MIENSHKNNDYVKLSRKNITYLAHDLGDATIAKRLRMLKHCDGTIALAGFYRTKIAPATIECVMTQPFARTANGGFLNRILNVIKICVRIHKHRALFTDSDIIIARNLEMLAIAVRAKSAINPNAKVIYESLDIHRLLLRNDLIGKTLRGMEEYLVRRADKIWTSSPAFIDEYFKRRTKISCPIQLVENKIFDPNQTLMNHTPTNTPLAPPWVIGWFGAIRCRKSLSVLCALAASMNGQVNVIIRGKPAYDQIPDFDAIIDKTEGVTFHDAYKNPDDLAQIYGETHFTWAIDMFEEGLNSSWLLPNRLYEGGAFHTVPIAIENVETGHAIKRMNIGVTLASATLAPLQSFFVKLSLAEYAVLKEKSEATPQSQWFHNDDECKTLLEIKNQP